MKIVTVSKEVYDSLSETSEEFKNLYGEKGKLINKFIEDFNGNFVSETPENPNGERFLKLTLTKNLVKEMLLDGRAHEIN